MVLVRLKRPFEAPQIYEPLVTPGSTAMLRLARVGFRHIWSDWSVRSHHERTAERPPVSVSHAHGQALLRQYTHTLCV